MGIYDAFRVAELVVAALDDAFSGKRSYEEGMGEYQRTRDAAAMPVYEFTCEFATLEPPPPGMQQLIGAMQRNQEAMDGFISVQANTLPAPEFFAPENVGRIIGGAAVAGQAGRGYAWCQRRAQSRSSPITGSSECPFRVSS